MVIDTLYFFADLGDQGITLFRIEFQDTSHLDLHQFEDIIASHFPDKIRLERSQAQVDMSNRLIHIFGVFKLGIFIDTLFNEDFFKRGEEQGFFLLGLLDLKFRTQ